MGAKRPGNDGVRPLWGAGLLEPSEVLETSEGWGWSHRLHNGANVSAAMAANLYAEGEGRGGRAGKAAQKLE
jgi:hypothetical protein